MASCPARCNVELDTEPMLAGTSNVAKVAAAGLGCGHSTRRLPWLLHVGH